MRGLPVKDSTSRVGLVGELELGDDPDEGVPPPTETDGVLVEGTVTPGSLTFGVVMLGTLTVGAGAGVTMTCWEAGRTALRRSEWSAWGVVTPGRVVLGTVIPGTDMDGTDNAPAEELPMSTPTTRPSANTAIHLLRP